uniref:Ig-like domain-containing protein n=1 Tax=uncultured Methanobrevibacter sp. TaxID=253161 RepID=UPI0025FBE4D7
SIEPGNYTVVATYMGDSVFNTNTTSKDVEILGHLMKDTPIDVEVETNANRVTLTVKVDENATGFVEVKSGVSVSNIALENGEATLTITLPYGSYALDVTYLGDANYNKNSTKAEFTLVEPAKENTTISLDIDTVENNVTMTVTVDDTATGLVKFQITGPEEYTLYADVINGKAVLEYVLLTGDYTVVATYMGDDWYNTNITSEDFTIVGHIKKDTPISARADVSGNRVTLTVNVDENATGFVKLTVGGTVTNIEVQDGVATLTTVLVPNSYFVDVTYLGDNNYNMNRTSVTFTITDITKKNTNIDLNIDVYEDAALVMVDVNESATGLVKLYMVGKESGEEYTMYMDVISIEPGNYTVVATYMGDSVFNTNTTSKDVEILGHVKKDTPITADVVVDGNNVMITVTVNENATGFVKFTTSGSDIFAEVKDGKAIVTTVLPVGNYTVVAAYLGDEDFNGNETVISFSVAEGEETVVNITVPKDLKEGDNATVKVEIPGATGNVTVIVDGKETVIELVNGSAEVPISNVSGGEHDVVVIYSGDDKHASAYQASTFNVAKKPEKRGTEILAKDFTQYACEYYEGERGRNFTFQLVDLNGTPLANKTIYIGYNGVILNRTTDANGYASVQINLKNACLYTFVLVFLDDDNYNASLAVQKITINKKTTSITASAKTFKATAKTKKYTVTLKTIKGASIDGKTYLKAGKKVTLLINGRIYTAKTNSKGKATFNIKLTKKGKFTAKISFAGDVTYKGTSKKVKITIK